MAASNSLNINQTGLVNFDGTSNFTGVTVTQHDLIVGGSGNSLTSVAPSATAGVPVVSAGAGADPAFGTATVPGGGTGQTSLTAHGVLVGNGTSAVTQLAAGSAGQVLQSGGAAADPTYSTATYPATAGTTGTVLQSNGTNIVNSTAAYPSTSGATGTLLQSNGTNIVNTTATYPGTAGTSGTVLQSNGTNIVNTTAKYPGTSGTTGTMLQSNGTNWVNSTPTYPTTAGTAGKVLVSDGTNIVSSTPTFPNASATSGKFIRSDGTNWIASTPTLPTTAGTSGKVLVSDGTNFVSSTPTFPNASASSGKFIQSDGTNWIASTPTLPTTAGTSGTVLQSNGTNFVNTTATYPGTAGTASTLLRSDGTNWVNCANGTTINSSGIYGNTNQPHLRCQSFNSQTNCTGDGTFVVIIFDNIDFQQGGSNYDNTTGIYTIPSTGQYLFIWTVSFTGITAAMTSGNIGLFKGTDNNNGFCFQNINPANLRTVNNEFAFSGSFIINATAADTYTIQATIGGGSKVASTKVFYGAKSWSFTNLTVTRIF